MTRSSRASTPFAGEGGVEGARRGLVAVRAVRLPQDKGECHEDNDAPEPDENRKHDALLLEGLDIDGEDATDEAVVVVVPSADRRLCDRLCRLVHRLRGQGEVSVVDARDVNVEVVVQEREGLRPWSR